MTRQPPLEFFGASRLPVHEIKAMILDRGRLSKDEIKLLWDLSEDDNAALKAQLEDEKLFEPGPRGQGGFVARFHKPPAPAREKDKVADIRFR